jgi:hypothetical protein
MTSRAMMNNGVTPAIRIDRIADPFSRTHPSHEANFRSLHFGDNN